MVRVSTSTHTFARFSLLAMQIRVLLQETVRPSADSLGKLSVGLKPPSHYIEVVVLEGHDAKGKIRIQVKLSIDWREHSLQVSSSDRISTPGSWSDGVSPVVTEVARTFRDVCAEKRLTKRWFVRYGAHHDREAVNRKLGFSPAERREWHSPPVTMRFDVERLNELVVEVSVSD
jgi:hypothetical protein